MYFSLHYFWIEKKTQQTTDQSIPKNIKIQAIFRISILNQLNARKKEKKKVTLNVNFTKQTPF